MSSFLAPRFYPILQHQPIPVSFSAYPKIQNGDQPEFEKQILFHLTGDFGREKWPMRRLYIPT
jgi:hypothetical protein